MDGQFALHIVDVVKVFRGVRLEYAGRLTLSLGTSLSVQ